MVKKVATLLAVILLSACSQTMPEVDSAQLTNSFDQLKAQPVAVPPGHGQVRYLQAKNQKTPCRIALVGDSVFQQAKWFGRCKKGYASGLGVSELINGEHRILNLEEYSTPGKSVTFWHFNNQSHLLFVGRGTELYRSGRQLQLTLDQDGYYSLTDGYLFIDQVKGDVFAGAVNKLLGSQRVMHGYGNGTTFMVETSQDGTNNIAATFNVMAASKLMFGAVRLRNGSVVTVHNGQYEDASPILPYIVDEVQQTNQYMPISENDFAEGFSKYRSASAQLCQTHGSELSEFCSSNPFAAFGDELRKTAQYQANARQQRAAQIQQQQMVAQIQRQQQYQALSNTLDNLNKVSQNMTNRALQNIQSMPLPSPVIPSNNSVNIYTCQNVANWSYCRQQR